jgi:hypothetical protein
LGLGYSKTSSKLMNIFLDKQQEMMYNNYINNKNKKLNLGGEAANPP